jgi:DUF1680 family protein
MRNDWKVKINDPFWSKRIKLVHDEVLPYQWEAINDRIPGAEPSHAIRNFRIAAGLEQGEFYGFAFQDTDVAKWLEAVAYRLETDPDPELEKLADEVIELIGKAQHEDGYLNTYFTVKEPGKRWTNLRECHELYTAGHFMEAAAAYYHATGKKKLLDILCRFADHIDSVFGRSPGKLPGYPGHQEIELALVKLYEATGNEKYLKLSKYFLDERGREPFYFDIESAERGNTVHSPDPVMYNRKYAQTHLPVKEQDAAEGHAVRAVYMLAGMADVAALAGEEDMLEACRRLWNNIVAKRMYITGGIGSMAYGEAFSFDYDLPNDTMYTETCASVGLIFFAHRMLKIEPKSGYADELERALYNNVLAGMAQDGKGFFYVNPLEVLPEACEKNATYKHVKPVRQRWYACACCPPNIARLLASLGQYIYTVKGDTVYTHLYIGNETRLKVGGRELSLKLETNYPWDGKIGLEVSGQEKQEQEAAVALRIPGWCKKYRLTLNGLPVNAELRDGYAVIRRSWKQGELLELELDMPAEWVRANPAVRADAGRLAIQRGPLVYCLEETDNGSNLSALSVPGKGKPAVEYDAALFGGIYTIGAEGWRTDASAWGNRLYGTAEPQEIPVRIKAVPYFLWGNRRPGEMIVWVRQGCQNVRNDQE